MRIYAALTGSGEDIKCISDADYPRVLISFAYDKKRSTPDSFPGLDFVFDSGAFTAWSSGEPVVLDEYVEWCLAHQAQHPGAIFANLDVIPGEKTRRPSKREVTAAIKQGMRNADVLRDAGLPLIEAIHVGEPFTVLRELVARRRPEDRLAIGGLVGNSRAVSEKRAYCDAVFAKLRDDHGGWGNLPPVHGFGVAPEAPLGRRYPWYSIDATTWLRPARYGYKVARGGSMTKSSQHNPSRVAGSRRVYFVRILRRWARLEDQLGGMWESRGIRYAEGANV